MSSWRGWWHSQSCPRLCEALWSPHPWRRSQHPSQRSPVLKQMPLVLPPTHSTLQAGEMHGTHTRTHSTDTYLVSLTHRCTHSVSFTHTHTHTWPPSYAHADTHSACASNTGREGKTTGTPRGWPLLGWNRHQNFSLICSPFVIPALSPACHQIFFSMKNLSFGEELLPDRLSNRL